jgi:exodeoxyribonuclease V gamma subunit
MAVLQITTSNMMEILVAHLADTMSTPLKSPLSEEIVLINSRGMEKWLSMQLAERHGVCANMSFNFPRPFLLGLLESATETPRGSNYYHPDCLTWTLMKILPAMILHESFREIRHYLDRDGSVHSTKLYQLSHRIAQVIDQYLVYRPEMILNWEAGRTHNEDELWQAELWRAITAESPEPHPPSLVSRFKERLLSSNPESLNLPERISLIGISSLPPLFIELLNYLASFTDVHLFLFNPCREFWSGIMTHREMESTIQRYTTKTETHLSEEELFLEQGNPLLASMGKVNRDFLTAFADVSARHQDFFVLPGEATLLRCLQSDILNLMDRGKGEDLPLGFSDEDRSLEIHSCHSPMREVEVLYDCLLSLFDADRGLQPRDILVMTPDIDTYAPFIESVFDRTKEETVHGLDSHIPFSIADRKHLRNNPLTDAFFKILELPESRFEASRILALLDNRAIRDAFRIGEDDPPMISRWVEESGIRWGIDTDTLAELGLPPQESSTWRRGIDKMLLGYALPGGNRHLFLDILPYDAIEGENAQVLGQFLDFLDRLFAAVSQLKETHTLKQWHEILDDIVERFFEVESDDDWIFDHRHLLDAIHDLSKAEAVSGFDELVPLAVIREHLKDRLESAGFSGGFLTGGVTFCAMVPMRNIPFKVICLLGMSHQSFPREAKKLGFDLIARHPRRGDRSKRDDDRYLFLETLLSARERLIIFHTGQSIHDNTPIPPTVVVSELLDYIEQGFFLKSSSPVKTREWHEGRSAIRNHLVTEHPLQPFSPGYFAGTDGPFSYSNENCRAAQSLIDRLGPPRPFLSDAVPLTRENSENVIVSDLLGFFRHPARFFVTKTLGIRLPEEEDKLDDTELFTLTGLTRYEVEQSLLAGKMEDDCLEDEYRILLSSGKLPLGTIGQMQHDVLSLEISRFATRVARLVPDENKQPLPIDLPLGDYRLTGQIDLWSPAGIFACRYAELKGKDYLNVWFQHLILHVARPELAWENYLAGRKEWLRFTKPDQAADLLICLLDLFRDGLTRPLKFFPQTSLQYVKALNSGKSRQAALASARSAWQVTDFFRGEERDPYFRLCFGKSDPLDEEFCTLAESVYKPLLSHQLPLSDAD